MPRREAPAVTPRNSVLNRPIPLSCRETLRRLDDYVDRELEPLELESVRRHLDACADCLREFRFEETLIADFRDRLRRVRAPRTVLDGALDAIARAGRPAPGPR